MAWVYPLSFEIGHRIYIAVDPSKAGIQDLSIEIGHLALSGRQAADNILSGQLPFNQAVKHHRP